MGIDRPPEQEIEVLMPIEAYETAEMRLAGRVWYCWSNFLKAYWEPGAKGGYFGKEPEGWPGHTARCGWKAERPEPFEATA